MKAGHNNTRGRSAGETPGRGLQEEGADPGEVGVVKDGTSPHIWPPGFVWSEEEGRPVYRGDEGVAPGGWSPLEFYAWIVRTLGIPDKFRLTDEGWVADAPFTKATDATLAMLEGHGV